MSMTIDELKKEAREKSASNHNYINHYYVNGYVEGSEPREKRIDCLTLACENYKEEMEKNLADAVKLEKENAELKKWKEDTIKARGNDYMAWSRQNDQLTKAKELLKWFVWYFREDYNNVPYKHKVGEAEQFLSEVEK